MNVFIAKRLSRVLIRIALGLLAGLIAIGGIWGLAEISIRAYFAIRDARNPYIKKELRKHAALQEAYDLSLWEIPGVKYKKNASLKIDLEGEELWVKINSKGFRTREFRDEKPADLYRIICVGGSTTVIGRTNEETYPALLEKKLKARFPEKEIEVLNFGVSKYGTSEVINLCYDSMKYRPDLFLKYNGMNDLWWDYFIMLSDRLPAGKKLLSRSYIFQWFFWKCFLPPADVIREDFENGLYPPLKELIFWLRKSGSDMIMITFFSPDLDKLTGQQKYYLDFSIRTFWGRQLGTLPFIRIEPYLETLKIYNQTIRDFCEKNNIACVDLNRQFPHNFNLYIDPCHFSQEGIEKASEIICRELLEKKIIK